MHIDILCVPLEWYTVKAFPHSIGSKLKFVACTHDVPRYADGSHYIGPHSDDETQLAPGAPIYSVSWGATRRFRLLPRKRLVKNIEGGCVSTRETGKLAQLAAGMKLDLEVGDGDLVVMGGECQKTHKHEVPKTSQLVGRRINATFRTFAQRVHADRINGAYP